MKKLQILLLTIMLTVSCIGVYGQQTEKIQFSNLNKERDSNGEQLHISYRVTVPNGIIKSQEILYVYPTLISKDGKHKHALKNFAFSGKRRLLLIKRAKKHHNKTTLPKADVLCIENEELILSDTIPFKRWMTEADIQVKEQYYSCAECPAHQEERRIPLPIIKIFSPKDYVYAFVEPDAVQRKIYEESFESKVNFKVAQSDLLVNYKDNINELNRLAEFISRATRYEGATLQMIYVEGYASPEGNFDSNIILSDNRAKVLADYVKNKYKRLISRVSMNVKGYGEDWDGLKLTLKDSDVSYAAKVIDIINEYPNADSRKTAIKSLDGGAIYKDLLDNFYPQLRRTTFRMSYQVRSFMDGELERAFLSNPKLMSHNELFRLAKQYEAEGKNSLPIYETAYKMFPKEDVAVLNYANALLKYSKGNERESLTLLQSIPNDQRTKMPMAIALDKMGLSEEAEKVLMK